MNPAPAVYYNEFDKQKAAWLRELIGAKVIAPGDVDERSIADVRPDDIRGYRQCHFFSGIGIWSYALRLAGWPDDREVWTGSCPCQPFSDAGKKEAFDDARHLWPEFFRLIEARRPLVCFGEQVASADGLAWLDAVYADLDHADYSTGALDLCAAGLGAPHRRQRLYWVADSDEGGRGRRASDAERIDGDGQEIGRIESNGVTCGGSAVRELADAAEQRHDGRRASEAVGRQSEPERLRTTGRVADANCERRQQDARGALADETAHGSAGRVGRESDGHHELAGNGANGPCNGFWAGSDWVLTRPQRVGDRPGLRPVEAGSQPVVDGVAEDLGCVRHSGFPLAKGEEARLMRLRGYGDGIVAEVAAAFISAYSAKSREDVIPLLGNA